MRSAGAVVIPGISQKIARRELHDPKVIEEVNAGKTAGDTETPTEVEETIEEEDGEITVGSMPYPK